MRILITGGASGLGEAMTKKFAGNPSYRVFFTYRSSSENAEKISRDFQQAKGIYCDFNDPGSVANLINELEAINPDVLIHNAYDGKFIDTYFHKTPAEAFQQNFQSNILPVIRITQACIDLFRKKKSGVILTVLSPVTEEELPIGTSLYAATKGYLHQLAKSWAVENKKFNIVSAAVSPDLMITSMTERLDERLLEQLKESSHEKRFLKTEEAADLIARLLDDPTTINGKNIRIHPKTN
jgi:NAD(P)-dependent dehydrogenase (short-subunit alcohol dehydrogenase family)